jgi:hypothetical protein
MTRFLWGRGNDVASALGCQPGKTFAHRREQGRLVSHVQTRTRRQGKRSPQQCVLGTMAGFAVLLTPRDHSVVAFSELEDAIAKGVPSGSPIRGLEHVQGGTLRLVPGVVIHRRRAIATRDGRSSATFTMGHNNDS